MANDTRCPAHLGDDPRQEDTLQLGILEFDDGAALTDVRFGDDVGDRAHLFNGDTDRVEARCSTRAGADAMISACRCAACICC